jgi:hypothetical protein
VKSSISPSKLVKGLLSDFLGRCGSRGSKMYLFSIELSWGSGYGAMCLRERLWNSKCAARWVGGVLMMFMGRMGWDYVKVL